jgi:hypothetical protein
MLIMLSEEVAHHALRGRQSVLATGRAISPAAMSPTRGIYFIIPPHIYI